MCGNFGLHLEPCEWYSGNYGFCYVPLKSVDVLFKNQKFGKYLHAWFGFPHPWISLHFSVDVVASLFWFPKPSKTGNFFLSSNDPHAVPISDCPQTKSYKNRKFIQWCSFIPSVDSLSVSARFWLVSNTFRCFIFLSIKKYFKVKYVCTFIVLYFVQSIIICRKLVHYEHFCHYQSRTLGILF